MRAPVSTRCVIDGLDCLWFMGISTCDWIIDTYNNIRNIIVTYIWYDKALGKVILVTVWHYHSVRSKKKRDQRSLMFHICNHTVLVSESFYESGLCPKISILRKSITEVTNWSSLLYINQKNMWTRIALVRQVWSTCDQVFAVCWWNCGSYKRRSYSGDKNNYRGLKFSILLSCRTCHQ